MICLFVLFVFELFDERFEFFLINFFLVSVDELLKVLSRHHILNAEQSESSSVISDSILRIIVGSDLFASIHCSKLRLSILTLLFCIFTIFNFEDLLLQNLSCSFPVSILTPILLIHNTDSCGYVSSSASTLSFIHRLASRTTWFHVLIFDISFIEIEIKRYRWHYNHWDCWRMNSSFGFSLRNTNNFMNSWFAFKNFIDLIPLNFKVQSPKSPINSGIPGWWQGLNFPPHTLTIANNHFTKLLNKKRRLWASSTRPEFEDYLLHIVVHIWGY